MVDYVELEEDKKCRDDKNKYITIVGKEYMSIHILIFRITILFFFMLGFILGAWLL